jgi:hypothetical protein
MTTLSKASLNSIASFFATNTSSIISWEMIWFLLLQLKINIENKIKSRGDTKRI